MFLITMTSHSSSCLKKQSVEIADIPMKNNEEIYNTFLYKCIINLIP